MGELTGIYVRERGTRRGGKEGLRSFQDLKYCEDHEAKANWSSQ